MSWPSSVLSSLLYLLSLSALAFSAVGSMSEPTNPETPHIHLRRQARSVPYKRPFVVAILFTIAFYLSVTAAAATPFPPRKIRAISSQSPLSSDLKPPISGLRVPELLPSPPA